MPETLAAERGKDIFAHDMYEKVLAKPLIYGILHTQSVKKHRNIVHTVLTEERNLSCLL